MAAPLLHEEGALGVLSVLDRPEQTLFSLQEMELLGLFANQAAIAVDLLLKAREGRAPPRVEAAASSRSSRASRPPLDGSRTNGERLGLRLLARPRRHARSMRKRPGGLGRPASRSS